MVSFVENFKVYFFDGIKQPYAKEEGRWLKQHSLNFARVEHILLVPWVHILKHCYQQEFACKHTKILLVDILVPVFRPHFTVCNPLSNINI